MENYTPMVFKNVIPLMIICEAITRPLESITFVSQLVLQHKTFTPCTTLSYNHTERQAAASSEASEFGNGSGVDLEHQVERHIQVNGDLPLPLDARCGYTLIVLSHLITCLVWLLFYQCFSKWFWCFCLSSFLTKDLMFITKISMTFRYILFDLCKMSLRCSFRSQNFQGKVLDHSLVYSWIKCQDKDIFLSK